MLTPIMLTIQIMFHPCHFMRYIHERIFSAYMCHAILAIIIHGELGTNCALCILFDFRDIGRLWS